MSSTATDKIFRRFYADAHGRIVGSEERSVPFPAHCDDACDTNMHYIDSSNRRCEKTDMPLDVMPWCVGGIVTIEVGTQAVFASLPAGTYICEGIEAIAELQHTDDFAWSTDLPGDYELTFDAPRHLPKTITVRVLPRSEPQP